MARHKGPRDDRPGTDAGKPFSEMSGAEKGKEFDASDANPVGYAERNFGASHETEQSRRGRTGR